MELQDTVIVERDRLTCSPFADFAWHGAEVDSVCCTLWGVLTRWDVLLSQYPPSVLLVVDGRAR